VLAIAVSLLPVCAFLGALVLCDSFKLVPTRTLAGALAAGTGVAFVAWALHAGILAMTGVGPVTFSRYLAPITEEALKAAFVLYAISRRRVGFLVDAAILGFAIGTGFAVVENVEYLMAPVDRRLWVWIVRGFGTAMLHASTTAIVAVGTKALLGRYPRRGLAVAAGPWVGAVLLHSLFNHAQVSPLLAAGVPMIVLPLVVMFVFDRSERATREWVGEGLDLDVELLRLVRSSHFGETRIGRYLQELKSRFPGPVVADMFCLLQLELELGIRAKGMLMARDAGLELPIDQDLRQRLDERAYLRRTIGPTGLLALRPLQVTTDRDEWHEYLLHHSG
jgi:protease PrsW